MKKNLYEILEVSMESSADEIEEAMIRLGKKYAHTDQINGITFSDIQAAYQTLSSPYRRTAYDVSLEEEMLLLAQQRQPFLRAEVQAFLREGLQIFLREGLQTFLREGVPDRKAIYALLNVLKERGKIIQHRAKLLSKKRRKISIAAIDRILVPGETISYQAAIHWLFCLDIAAVLLICIVSYFLISDPYGFQEHTPTTPIWFPRFLTANYPEVSVWILGLNLLLFVGILVLIEACVQKQTIGLVMTSKRIIVQYSFLGKQVVEIRLMSFESITVTQSLWGRIFNYGTITLTGIGHVKTVIPFVTNPFKLKQALWQILAQQSVV